MPSNYPALPESQSKSSQASLLTVVAMWNRRGLNLRLKSEVDKGGTTWHPRRPARNPYGAGRPLAWRRFASGQAFAIVSRIAGCSLPLPRDRSRWEDRRRNDVSSTDPKLSQEAKGRSSPMSAAIYNPTAKERLSDGFGGPAGDSGDKPPRSQRRWQCPDGVLSPSRAGVSPRVAYATIFLGRCTAQRG
jgi:hypothetical protein